MAEITAAPELEAVEALKAVKAGHADDVDIAARILADNIDIAGAEIWTVAEDKKLIKKVDWRLIQIVSLSHSYNCFW
jgi:MFS transporter, ACS family, allantoate permease